MTFYRDYALYLERSRSEIFIRTNHYSLRDDLVDSIRGDYGCLDITYHENNSVTIRVHRNDSDRLGEQVYWQIVNAGWLTAETTENGVLFRRTFALTSIVDELDRLTAMRDRGEISPTQYDAAKYSLLGVA